jgi:hypothetical protein
MNPDLPDLIADLDGVDDYHRSEIARYYERTVKQLEIARARVDEALRNLTGVVPDGSSISDVPHGPDDPTPEVIAWTQLRELADHAGYSGTIQATIAETIAWAARATGLIDGAVIGHHAHREAQVDG